MHYKTINYDNQSHLIVKGFIDKIGKDINTIFINIPKDIFEMVYKYYYIPDDIEWTQLVKYDKNNKYMRNMFSDYLYVGSGCVIVNNGNDIFMFGGQAKPEGLHTNDIFRLNITTNVLRRLTDIKCPSCEKGMIVNWYAVFCTKSEQVHLFHRSSDVHVAISLETLNNAPSVIVDE